MVVASWSVLTVESGCRWAGKVLAAAGPTGVEDTASVLIELENGAHAAIQSSFSQDPGEDRFAVHGTKGSIIIDDFNSGSYTVTRYGKKQETFTLPPPPQAERHRALVENLAAAAKGEAQLFCPGQEGLDVTRVIETVLSEEV